MAFDPKKPFTVDTPPPPPQQGAPAQAGFDPAQPFEPVPVVDVGGPRYDPSIPAGQQGSQLVPAAGGEGQGQGPPAMLGPIPPQPPDTGGQVPVPIDAILPPNVQGPPVKPPIAEPPPEAGWGRTAGLAASKFGQGAAHTLALPADYASFMANNAPPGVAGFGPLGLPVAAANWAMGNPLAKLGLTPSKPLVPSGVGSEMVDRGYKAIGLPEPVNANERLLSGVSSALGGTAAGMGVGGALRGIGSAGLQAIGRALTAAPAAQLSGAVGSGVAGNVAHESGTGPVGEVVGSLAGGLGGAGVAGGFAAAARAARALAHGFTPAGARQIAAEILLRHSSDPATLQGRLQTGLAQPNARLPGAPVTTAMAANDPALLVRERALRTQPGGLGVRAVEAQRGQQVGAALGSMATAPTMTSTTRGLVIRQALGNQARALKARTTQLYNAAKQAKGQFPTGKLLNAVADTVRQFYGPGAGKAPAAFRDIAQQIAGRGTSASAEWLMNMDRQIGKAIGQAKLARDDVLAGALGKLRDEVGSINPTPEYAAAKAWRARVGEVMGRDEGGAKATGDIARTDQFGRPIMPDEQVAARAVRDAGSVRQIIRAGEEAVAAAQARGAPAAEITRLRNEAQAARTVMRDQFLDNAESGARLSGDTVSLDAAGQPTTSPSYSPAGWRRFWDKNEETARLLFNPAERQTLRQLTEQLAETAAADRTAAAKGSDTAQNVFFSEKPSVAHIFASMTRGRVNPDSVAGKLLFELSARGALGAAGFHLLGPVGLGAGALPMSRVGQILFAHQDEAVRAILHDAMANPQLAQDLLREATPETLARVMRQFQGGAVGELVGEAAARGTIQSDSQPGPPAIGAAAPRARSSLLQ